MCLSLCEGYLIKDYHTASMRSPRSGEGRGLEWLIGRAFGGRNHVQDRHRRPPRAVGIATMGGHQNV
jgi:hypothetical protein